MAESRQDPFDAMLFFGHQARCANVPIPAFRIARIEIGRPRYASSSMRFKTVVVCESPRLVLHWRSLPGLKRVGMFVLGDVELEVIEHEDATYETNQGTKTRKITHPASRIVRVERLLDFLEAHGPIEAKKRRSGRFAFSLDSSVHGSIQGNVVMEVAKESYVVDPKKRVVERSVSSYADVTT
jgi:hypothetical protein